MRVPYWLRGPTLEKLVAMRDQFSRSRVDLIKGLEKTSPHYQRAYTLAPNFQSRPGQYRASERTHVYDRETGITSQIDEDQPVRPLMPPEAHLGLWGGEGVLKGFTKRSKKHVRAPRWWMPHLRETAFYSEILDKHYLIIVTHTTLERIDAAFGFDNYILQTPAVDLHSPLGMRLRREMLVTLAKKSLYPHDPQRRDEILEKYKRFIIPERDSVEPIADPFLDEIFQEESDHELAAGKRGLNRDCPPGFVAAQRCGADGGMVLRLERRGGVHPAPGHRRLLRQRVVGHGRQWQGPGMGAPPDRGAEAAGAVAAHRPLRLPGPPHHGPSRLLPGDPGRHAVRYGRNAAAAFPSGEAGPERHGLPPL
ncbi:uncharacterized protein LOC129601764 isoform X2 [Paramacrobiotus metropolitanus]|uniref:uncharacterized protein LOC129601764 isoform X2 n=1 Tax=Paramacrobiotus metropolitanus TaxID=2943436 RepID=UPI00244569C9|nr:uncharacterized protein LOC129601764 isoform X2 [Paramacrobiotus metropolitanus]